MKTLFTILALILVSFGFCFAQASGNIGYSQGGGNARAAQEEISKRTMTQEEIPPTSTSMFLETSALMNIKADEYVAVFGITQEGSTLAECAQKMDITIQKFTDALKALGIGGNDVFVDFVAQNKIYGYEVTGDIAKEKLTGFELKKNVAVHYRDYSLLDKLVLAASRAQIFDLIKVDYIVRNIEPVQNRLMEEAARIIKQKAARYERLFGIKLTQPVQVYAAKPSIYYPSEVYDSYTAYESEDVDANVYRQKYLIQGARKSRTFFFNGLNAKGFDVVVNPVVIEPVVQFTLYLKMRYETQPGHKANRAKASSGKARRGSAAAIKRKAISGR